MELGCVEELMELLHTGQRVRHSAEVGHALRTAALLRRSRPADKELQVTPLALAAGELLWPADPGGRAERTAAAVRGLLGERVALLVSGHPWREPDHRAGGAGDGDLAGLREAAEDARAADLDAGVLEDWRPVLERVAARAVTGDGRRGGPRRPSAVYHLPGA